MVVMIENIAPTYMLQTQHLHHPTGVISVSIVVSRFSAGSLLGFSALQTPERNTRAFSFPLPAIIVSFACCLVLDRWYALGLSVCLLKTVACFSIHSRCYQPIEWLLSLVITPIHITNRRPSLLSSRLSRPLSSIVIGDKQRNPD